MSRQILRRRVIVAVLLFAVGQYGFAQEESVLGGVVVPTAVYEAALPQVNSGGLRVRDFPSINAGTILGMLDVGTKLNIEAVTGWKDAIDGGSFPWYLVQTRSSPRLTGWVYGMYVSFKEKYPEDFWQPELATRAHMNRVLLVRQIFRTIFGTFSIKVSDKWLKTASLQKESPYTSDATFRTYQTSFGTVVIIYRASASEHLVIHMEVDRPVPGLLVNVGDTLQQLESTLGNDHVERNGLLTYTVSQLLDAYSVGVVALGGTVTDITATALLN